MVVRPEISVATTAAIPVVISAVAVIDVMRKPSSSGSTHDICRQIWKELLQESQPNVFVEPTVKWSIKSAMDNSHAS